MDDIHHVLHSQGLEIQFICRGVVRGHSLRIIVDDNSLIAQLLEGSHRMDRRVVKFHPLADSYGTGAQNDDLLPF